MLIPVLCLVGFGCNKPNSSFSRQQQESPMDTAISTKVKEGIKANKSLASYENIVTVTTNGGVVTLSGDVAKKKDADKIVKMTQKVEGVQGIDNQLVIKSY
jgi:osmotically-inducible protein OsmY